MSLVPRCSDCSDLVTRCACQLGRLTADTSPASPAEIAAHLDARDAWLRRNGLPPELRRENAHLWDCERIAA